MRKAAKITFKILLGTVTAVVLLLVIVVLLLRLPAVQTYVTHKAVAFISDKTHTRIELGKVYIAFPKSVVIEELFAEDTNHDTLLYLKKLKVDIDMLALLKKRVEVNSLYLGGVNANIVRNESDSTFNFDFLIKAFSSGEKKEKVVKEKSDTAAWEIGVEKLALENIRGGYQDNLTGTGIRGLVGKLDLKMNSINIKNLGFDANELSLSDSRVDIVIRNSSVKESMDSVRALLPSIALTKLRLHNVRFAMSHAASGLQLAINAGNLVTEPKEIDLNKQVIRVNTLQMDSSNGLIALRRNEDGNKKDSTGKNYTAMDNGWLVEAGELNLKKVDFNYDISNAPELAAGMDYNHLHFKDINLHVNDALYSPQLIKADIKQLAVAEHSGFMVKNLTGRAVLDDTHIEVTDLLLSTPHTHISRYFAIRYPSLATLGKNIQELGVDADLQNTSIALSDILFFAPMLKNQPPFTGASGQVFAVNGKVKGKLKDVTFNNLTVKGVGSTYIALSGHITGLPDAMNAVYDIDLKKLSTTKADLQAIVGDKLPASINVPGTIDLTAKVNGTFRDIKANFNLQTSSGSAAGEVALKRMDGDTQYVAKLNTQALDIGYILKNDSLLGPVTAQIDLKGKNLSLSTLQADLDAQVESITLKGYAYKNIDLKATANGQVYKADMKIKDKNLVLDMKADIDLVKEQEAVKIDLNLEGADLQQLKLLKEDLRVSGRLNTDLKGSIDNLTGQAGLNDVVFIKDDETYRVGSFAAVSVNDKKRSAIKVSSGIVNADYQGSMKIGSVAKAITAYINNYFTLGAEKQTVVDTSLQDFKLQVKILPHPLINGIILPDLEKFNGAELSIDFNTEKQQLDIITSVTGLAYKGNKLDNMEAEIHGDKNALKYSIAFDQLKSGNFNLAQTNIDGTIKGDSIDFSLKIHDRDSADKLLMAGILTQDTPKEYTLRLDNKQLVFANQKWELPEDNYIHFGKGGFYVHRLDMTNNMQQLSINSEKDDAAAPIKVVFKNFQLGTLSQIVEKDTGLIRGLLNGEAELRNLNTTPAFVSDLKMVDVAYKQNVIGDIQVKADNLTADKYTAQVIISGADNDVKVSGYYAPNGSENQLNFKADVNRLQLHSVEGFTNGQLRETSGYMTGEVTISGTGKQPVINGDMRFKEVGANVAYLNNHFSLKDEQVRIDGKGVYFNSFRVLDANGQRAVIDGKVLTSDFKEMKFDMTINTNRFTVINTTIADNPLYFGHVVLNSKISVKGDNNLPIIRINAKLIDGSAFTVVIPSSKIKVDRGEGIVYLVDTSTANGIMNKTDTVIMPTTFKGLDLSANLEVNKATTFKLIVDKTSGDSLVVRGDGMFSFSMDESGRQSLTGTYVLSDGGYKASFKGVIRREFKIRGGSTITFNGQPTDATVNINASYSTRTSPADLLSGELANSSTAERSIYRKPLHFDVLMNMRGALLKPVITFQLDMPDGDKDAFGGTVYSKVNTLNNDPNELNKQVFSLLVLNSFMPSGSGGGGDAGTTATNIARNSVNQILSDQLNNLSGRFIKGVDLNFGIQTNDDYTTAGVQQRTEVSVGVKKEFFNNRLSVQVGTSINVQDNNGAVTPQGGGSNIPGDFVIEYKITKDGRYRLKAFRQNQYESLIDGLLYKTGVGIVYTRDYDTLKQLLKKPEKEKEEPPKENSTSD